jgi:hypothetical protein
MNLADRLGPKNELDRLKRWLQENSDRQIPGEELLTARAHCWDGIVLEAKVLFTESPNRLKIVFKSGHVYCEYAEISLLDGLSQGTSLLYIHHWEIVYGQS